MFEKIANRFQTFVLVALVSLANILLAVLPPFDGEPISLERLFGWIFAPLAWLIGIPWQETGTAGQLLGTKVILNELVAYLELAALPPGQLSERSSVILAYALCGFANLGSVGIMIGGLTAMVPERRQEIVALALPSVWCGLLATLMTGAMVGIVL